MTTQVNRAVQQNLERVLRDEQRGHVVRLGWARLVLSIAALVVLWLVPVPPESEAYIAPSRYGVLVFVVLSVGVMIFTLRAGARARWASLAVPLVDVPLLAVIQHLQMNLLPAQWMSIPTAVSLMCGCVVLASLSLSRAVIAATTVAALVGMTSQLLRVPGLDLVPLLVTSMVPVAIGVVLTTAMGRLKALLHESRARDLLGKYLLGERIGAGGMAEVFRATYSPEGGFERQVAVKRILPSYAQVTESVRLFRREAELGALLAHPGIVQVLDFGIDGDTYFLAMEYVDGLPLSKVLTGCQEQGRPLPHVAVATVAFRVAEALSYIHGRRSASGKPLGLVHRDLNPPNLLVSRIGEVKLADFGIARAAAAEQLTEAGIMRGKLGYSPPEQLMGQALDGRVDLFALGVTLHEVLTGKRLFQRETDTATLKACLEEPVPRPSALRADVPAELEQVVMRLLERDLAQRTPSADALLEQLRALPAALRDVVAGQRALAEVVVAMAPARRSGDASGTPTGPIAQPPNAVAATATLPSAPADRRPER